MLVLRTPAVAVLKMNPAKSPPPPPDGDQSKVAKFLIPLLLTWGGWGAVGAVHQNALLVASGPSTASEMDVTWVMVNSANTANTVQRWSASQSKTSASSLMLPVSDWRQSSVRCELFSWVWPECASVNNKEHESISGTALHVHKESFISQAKLHYISVVFCWDEQPTNNEWYGEAAFNFMPF